MLLRDVPLLKDYTHTNDGPPGFGVSIEWLFGVLVRHLSSRDRNAVLRIRAQHEPQQVVDQLQPLSMRPVLLVPTPPEVAARCTSLIASSSQPIQRAQSQSLGPTQ